MGNLKWKIYFMAVIMLVFVPILSANSASTPSPENPIKLTYGGLYGKNHPYSLAAQNWMKKIEKETGGRVRFTAYWGGSLFGPKDSWDELVKGVVDVTGTGGGHEYATAGFAIQRVAGAFFYGMSDAEVARRVYKEIFNKFPAVRSEFDGVKVIAVGCVSPYRFLTKNPVNTLKDLKDVMIRCTGADVAFLKGIGAEPVVMPMGEAYVSLEKGIIQAIWAPVETLKSLRFAEVAKYVSENSWLPWAYPKGEMNIKAYNNLPPDIRKIFDESGDYWGREISNQFLKLDKAGIKFGEEQGVTFFKLAPQDLKKIDDVREAVALQVAAELDAKGLPGTAIFKEVRLLIEKYNK